jgi:hypothetical protein
MNLHEMLFGTGSPALEFGQLVTPEERGQFNTLVTALAQTKGSLGGPALPAMLLLRIEDVVTSYFIVRRVEESLRVDGVLVKGKDNTTSISPAVEGAAKARERYRKALNELDEALAKYTHTENPALGIANRIRGLMIAAESIKDEPVALEAS